MKRITKTKVHVYLAGEYMGSVVRTVYAHNNKRIARLHYRDIEIKNDNELHLEA